MTAPVTPAAAKTVRLLHAVLTAGAVLTTVVLTGVRYVLNLPPLLSAPVLGYIFPVLSLVVLTLATVVMRPRVPARTREQSTDVFWNDVNIRGGALAVWALCEGSGVIGAVGYFITGARFSLAGTAAAVVALVWLRPAALEQLDS